MVLDYNFERDFNPYMAVRYLSMSNYYTPEQISTINRYQTVLSKKEFYVFLCEYLPYNKVKFLKYIKPTKQEKNS